MQEEEKAEEQRQEKKEKQDKTRKEEHTFFCSLQNVFEFEHTDVSKSSERFESP